MSNLWYDTIYSGGRGREMEAVVATKYLHRASLHMAVIAIVIFTSMYVILLFRAETTSTMVENRAGKRARPQASLPGSPGTLECVLISWTSRKRTHLGNDVGRSRSTSRPSWKRPATQARHLQDLLESSLGGEQDTPVLQSPMSPPKPQCHSTPGVPPSRVTAAASRPSWGAMAGGLH